MDPDSDETCSAVAVLDPLVRAMLAEDLPQQLAAARNALSQKDLVAAAEIVHSIRGSAAFCRLDPLRESARRLEADLKNNNGNADSINAFEQQVARVLRALERNQDH